MLLVKALVLFSALPAPADSQLLHFSASWCQPCREMEPIVARLQQAGYPIRHVDVDHERQLAARFRVDSVPCFVMLRGNREVDRVVGRVSHDRLRRMFQVPAATGPARPIHEVQTRSPRPADEPNGPGIPGRLASSSSSEREPAPRALAATVRLRVDDDRGRSFGTGTIIDVHKGEALVVTCAHIFRDSRGKGPIAVDLFHPQVRQPVTGTLVGYDMDRDVGLVSIQLPVPVTPVPVAGVDHRVRPGQPVFSAGCDRGGKPRTMQGRVTAVNRYGGPPNLSVSGQPVDGRSGGGLFTRDGMLIGVCNAADPRDDEGLYAAVASIHAQLDRAGLGFVYRRLAAPPVKTPARPLQASLGQELPDAVPARAEPLAVAGGEPATEAVSTADDSEVICIVRSRKNPRAVSRVIVLEQPSDDFMDRLAYEMSSRARPSRVGKPDPRGALSLGQRAPSRPGAAAGPPLTPVVIRGQTR